MGLLSHRRMIATSGEHQCERQDAKSAKEDAK